MSLVECIRVDQLLDRLGHLELHLKKLGLATHAQGVRNAIMLVQQDLNDSRLMAEGQPVAGGAIERMVDALLLAQERPP